MTPEVLEVLNLATNVRLASCFFFHLFVFFEKADSRKSHSLSSSWGSYYGHSHLKFEVFTCLFTLVGKEVWF